ncbi:MAG TPA: hypothetical protein VN328_03965 [Thermodesulfovibrionales bacterium]|nr:hypothetical protein [Thermodesulfovibrionales bacterium]
MIQTKDTTRTASPYSSRCSFDRRRKLTALMVEYVTLPFIPSPAYRLPAGRQGQAGLKGGEFVVSHYFFRYVMS